MSYIIKQSYLGGNNSTNANKEKNTTLIISVEHSKFKFSYFTYQILSIVKYVTLTLAFIIAIFNHQRILLSTSQLHPSFSTYPQRYNLTPTIYDYPLKNNTWIFLINLTYDLFLPMCYITAVALICELVVGSKIVVEKMIIIKGIGVQIESYTIRG